MYTTSINVYFHMFIIIFFNAILFILQTFTFWIVYATQTFSKLGSLKSFLSYPISLIVITEGCVDPL